MSSSFAITWWYAVVETVCRRRNGAVANARGVEAKVEAKAREDPKKQIEVGREVGR